MNKLGEALDELAKVDTLPAIEQYISYLRTSYELANVAFQLVNAPQVSEIYPLLFVTYDSQWVRRYLDQDYFQIDPIVVEGSKCFLPLDWENVDRSTARMRDLFCEAESYGVGKRGLTVPVRGPAGEKSLLTITSYESNREWANRRLSLLRDMHIVAHFIHDRCFSLAGLRPIAVRKRLSRRELQCMKALARGCAPKQIAFELELSISAVRLYIQSAKVKLGAGNTNHAIARVVQDEHLIV